MRVFIVKHLPSGLYLPPTKACHANTARKLTNSPRVFYQRNDAVFAARWWAKGLAMRRLQNSDFTDNRIVDLSINYEPIVSIPIDNRKLSDLRIIACDLTMIYDTKIDQLPN